MKPVWSHRWDLSPVEAVQFQNEIRRRVILLDDAAPFILPRLIAAVDVGYDRQTDMCGAALVIWDTVASRAVEHHTHRERSRFPYVPGLLSFREIPPLIGLFERLRQDPALVICDGQGYAHPRRAGLASHLGVLLDVPTLGWAKSRLIGEYQEPGPEIASVSPLMDRAEQIGWVLRSRSAVRPTFVSPGHRISLAGSLACACAMLGRYRLCEPARMAHRLTRELLSG